MYRSILQIYRDRLKQYFKGNPGLLKQIEEANGKAYEELTNEDLDKFFKELSGNE